MKCTWHKINGAFPFNKNNTWSKWSMSDAVLYFSCYEARVVVLSIISVFCFLFVADHKVYSQSKSPTTKQAGPLPPFILDFSVDSIWQARPGGPGMRGPLTRRRPSSGCGRVCGCASLFVTSSWCSAPGSVGPDVRGRYEMHSVSTSTPVSNLNFVRGSIIRGWDREMKLNSTWQWENMREIGVGGYRNTHASGRKHSATSSIGCVIQLCNKYNEPRHYGAHS